MKNQIKKIKSLDKKIIKASLNQIQKLFDGIQVIRGKNGYPYSFLPLTDFSSPMDPRNIEKIADLLIYFADFEKIDLIVSQADRGGGPLAQTVAIKVSLPYTLANWYRPNQLVYPNRSIGGVTVVASSGFAGPGKMCLNGIKKGIKVIILDDILSSGRTAEALIKCVHKIGSTVSAAVFVGENIDMGGRERIENKYRIPVKSLVRYSTKKEKTVVVS